MYFNLKELIDSYLKNYSVDNRRTFILYERNLNEFFDYFNNNIKSDNIENVNFDLVNNYLDNLKGKNYSKATISQKIATLKSFFKYLEKDHNINNLLKNLKINETASQKDFIPEQEIYTFLEFLNKSIDKNKWFRAYFYLLAFYDLDSDALLELDLGQISVLSNLITIKSDKINVKLENTGDSAAVFSILRDYYDFRTAQKIITNRFFSSLRAGELDKKHVKDVLLIYKKKLSLENLRIRHFSAYAKQFSQKRKTEIAEPPSQEKIKIVSQQQKNKYSADEIIQKIKLQHLKIFEHRQDVENIILIKGLPLGGKSYIIEKLKELFGGKDTLVLHCSVSAGIYGMLPLNQILYQIKNATNDQGMTSKIEKHNIYSKKLTEPLFFRDLIFEVLKQNKIILLIDDLDDFSHDQLPCIRYLLRNLSIISHKDFKIANPVMVCLTAGLDKNKDILASNAQAFFSENLLSFEIDGSKAAGEKKHLEDTIKSKLKTLDDIHRKIIEVIALCSGKIRRELLMNILQSMNIIDTANKIEFLKKEKFTKESEIGGANWIVFNNKYYCEIINFMMPPVRKTELLNVLIKGLTKLLSPGIEVLALIANLSYEQEVGEKTIGYLAQIANELEMLGHHDLAIIYYRKLYLIIQKGFKIGDYEKLCGAIAESFLKNGKHAEATDVLNKLIQHATDSELRLQTRHKLADLYLKIGELKKAKQLYEEVLKGQDYREYFLALSNYSLVLNSLGEYERSIRLFMQYADKTQNNLEKAIINNDIGVSYYYLGKYLESKTYIESAIKIASFNRDAKNHEHKFYNSLGLIEYSQGEITKALEFYLKSYASLRESNDDYVIAATLKNIANCQFRLGKYSAAIENYVATIELFERFGNEKEKGRVLCDLANIYVYLGAGDVAGELAKNIKQIAEFNDDILLRADALHLEGEVSKNYGLYNEAILKYEDALEIYKECGAKQYEFIAKINLVEALFKNKEHAKAKQLAIKVSRELEEENISDLKPHLYLLLTEIFLAFNDDGGAKKHLKNVNIEAMSTEFEIRWKYYWVNYLIAKKAQVEEFAADYLNRAKHEISRMMSVLTPELKSVFASKIQIREILNENTDREIVGEKLLKAIEKINNKINSLSGDVSLWLKALSHGISAARAFILRITQGSAIEILAMHDSLNAEVKLVISDFNLALIKQVAVTGEMANSTNLSFDNILKEFSTLKDLNAKEILTTKIADARPLYLYFERDYKTGAFNKKEELIVETSKHSLPTLVKAENLTPIQYIYDETLDMIGDSLDFIGQSKAIRKVLRIIDKIKSKDIPILITGESGTGKELIAKLIHKKSKRSGEKMISENCGAVADSLLESELFGHVRGAFSGATSDRVGLFEEANKGTLFLDEVGDMSSLMQKKLLRVLQEGMIRKVGDTQEKKIDVRIITATKKDLAKMISMGGFREDLYYRINVIELRLPPLKERIDDIRLLAEHFIKKYSTIGNITIEDRALELFEKYSWPGNVRELENVIQKVISTLSGDTITIDDILKDDRFLSVISDKR